MKALILVDLQNDFLPGGALAVPGGDEILPVVNKLACVFPYVVATQDWHPPGHKSFASSHNGKSIGDCIELEGVQQILWPDHCIQHTMGADFAPGLSTKDFDQVIQKGTQLEIDSYSGFYDQLKRSKTGLESWLKSKSINHCFIVGLATDYCVKFTALDAVGLGFETTVVTDACRAVNLNPDDEQHAWLEMKQAGVELTQSDNVLSRVLRDDR